MQPAFTKFDPHTFLGSASRTDPPAKAAKVAKAFAGDIPALAKLATLAGGHPGPSNSADSVQTALIAPTRWFERIALPVDGEPSFDRPCDARRGRMDEHDGLFLHFCAECGAWGAYGYGVTLRAGRLGRWYCAAHRPRTHG